MILSGNFGASGLEVVLDVVDDYLIPVGGTAPPIWKRVGTWGKVGGGLGLTLLSLLALKRRPGLRLGFATAGTHMMAETVKMAEKAYGWAPGIVGLGTPKRALGVSRTMGPGRGVAGQIQIRTPGTVKEILV